MNGALVISTQVLIRVSYGIQHFMVRFQKDNIEWGKTKWGNTIIPTPHRVAHFAASNHMYVKTLHVWDYPQYEWYSLQVLKIGFQQMPYWK